MEQKIKKLQEFKELEFPILSVCLSLDEKKTPTAKFILTQFNSLIKDKLSKEEGKLFRKDIERIKSFILNFNTRNTRSIVFFTAGEKLWETLDFEFPLSPFLTVSKTINLSPILQEINIHNKYLVLLIDREKARLFTVHLGNIEEHRDVFGIETVPQKVKQINEAWAREDKILRHIQDHLHRHLKFISESLLNFLKENKIHFNFMIIGGHEEIIPKVKKILPKNLREKVKGSFISELNIPLNDVFLESKKVAEKIGKLQ